MQVTAKTFRTLLVTMIMVTVIDTGGIMATVASTRKLLIPKCRLSETAFRSSLFVLKEFNKCVSAAYRVSSHPRLTLTHW